MMNILDNKKRLIIGSLIILTIIVAIIIFKTVTTHTPTKYPPKTVYNDPWSGETVIEESSDMPTERPVDDTIVMLGFSKLIDIGVTYNQSIALRSEFDKYRKSQKETITEISIDINTILSSVNNETGERTITFTTVINRKTKIQAQVTYIGLDAPSLVLSDDSGNQLYKS